MMLGGVIMLIGDLAKVHAGGLNSYYLIMVKHTPEDIEHYALIKLVYMGCNDYCYLVLNSSDRFKRYHYKNDEYHKIINVIYPQEPTIYNTMILGNLYQDAYFHAYVKHTESGSGHFIIGRIKDLETQIYEAVSYSFDNEFMISEDIEFCLLSVFTKHVTM